MTPTKASSRKSSTSTEPASGSRRRLLAAAALLPFLASIRPALARDAEAEAFVAQVGDQVVDILNRPDASDDEKLHALKDLLDANTDLELVARLVLGRHWRAASEQERVDYVALFRQILMNTLAEQLGNYTGETFQIIGSNALNEQDSAVQTRIMSPSNNVTYRVDWRIRGDGGRHAIIDVIAEGVSLVVSQRNEVGSIVERQGMAGLIEAMRERSRSGETVL